MIAPLEREKNRAFLAILRNMVEEEKAIRAHFQLGDEYNHIPLKLQLLLAKAEELLDTRDEETLPATPLQRETVVGEDEAMVYITLYHQRGQHLSAWTSLLNIAVLAELGVNRPVYRHRHEVERFIASKPDNFQHAYASVIVPKRALRESPEAIDLLGQPILRFVNTVVRDIRFVDFVHCKQMYHRDAQGILVEKTASFV